MLELTAYCLLTEPSMCISTAKILSLIVHLWLFRNRNQNSDNTWKSWGLLARTLLLFRVRRTGLWLDFPGCFGEALAPGPPWTPPSTSVSHSSPSSLPPVAQNHNNENIIWIKIQNLLWVVLSASAFCPSKAEIPSHWKKKKTLY